MLQMVYRNCSKRNTSNAPNVDLVGIQRATYTERPLLAARRGQRDTMPTPLSKTSD